LRLKFVCPLTVVQILAIKVGILENRQRQTQFNALKRMKKILLISRHEIILASLLNHLYENGFDSIGAIRDAEAVSFLQKFKPDLVILGGAFEGDEKEKLTAQLIDCQKDVKIISYRGGVKNLMEMVNSSLENV
jgi:PleD family two-component response regulator